MPSQNDNLSRPSWSTQLGNRSKMLYLLPICCLLLSGGVISCANVALMGSHSISVGDRTLDITNIGNIQPTQNGSAMIYLQGKVISQAPFLAAGAYQLQDATGTIWVMTNQTLPTVGNEVLLRGQLQFQSIPLGGQELGEVYIQEQEQLQ